VCRETHHIDRSLIIVLWVSGIIVRHVSHVHLNLLVFRLLILHLDNIIIPLWLFIIVLLFLLILPYQLNPHLASHWAYIVIPTFQHFTHYTLPLPFVKVPLHDFFQFIPIDIPLSLFNAQILSQASHLFFHFSSLFSLESTGGFLLFGLEGSFSLGFGSSFSSSGIVCPAD
jgi:hypothetical protein